MRLDEEKKLIIQEVLTLEDEWVIKAIKKLLDLDVYDEDEFSNEHKQLLEERVEEYRKTPSAAISLEKFIEELKAEGKL
ncbi:MAG: addiction module protein [Chitinophagaceae bacterium]